jgi:TPP-dependent pyruvate/acetoin dehydrogenase alpha subunit
MYVAMVQARVLDEHLAAVSRKSKGDVRWDSTRGQEACRVSTAIELGEGDLVSDGHRSMVMELMTGATVKSIMRVAASLRTGESAGESKRTAGSAGARRLPWMEDAGDRLRMAVGAAMALKTLKRRTIVVAYFRQGEVVSAVWLRMLAVAAKLDLPILFVVLPEAGGRKAKRLRARGVPAIPVDANDPVALYRVAQESIGRARSEGGPVVMECVLFEAEGRRGGREDDGLEQMKRFMLGRKVSNEQWLDGVAPAFRKRIGAANLGG